MCVVCASYGLVEATVGVGTVLIWDFAIAITREGGVHFHIFSLDRLCKAGTGCGRMRKSMTTNGTWQHVIGFGSM